MSSQFLHYPVTSRHTRHNDVSQHDMTIEKVLWKITFGLPIRAGTSGPQLTSLGNWSPVSFISHHLDKDVLAMVDV